VPMMDISGKTITLKDVAAEKGLLVIFTSNQCPFVIGSDGSEGWDGRYAELAEFSKKMGVGMALVNSNHANREKGESLENMKARYNDKKFGGYYLLDENNVIADAFAARTTPHVFLFDKDMKLVYKGAIDDNVASASAVKEHWLKNAITNMNEGKEIHPGTTRNIGCSIKRGSHAH
ncbi:MAG: redoxin family protein, partial [Bacteroidota bacterium]|nr:redoxin family protein [Bacteroidota bacterium]